MSNKQPVPNIPPVSEPTDAVSTDVIIDDQPISTDPSQTDLPADDSTIDDSGDSGDARPVAGDSLEKINKDKQTADELGLTEELSAEFEERMANLVINENAAKAARDLIEASRAKNPKIGNRPNKDAGKQVDEIEAEAKDKKAQAEAEQTAQKDTYLEEIPNFIVNNTPPPRTEMHQLLSNNGFEHVSTTGTHRKYKHPDGRSVTVPWGKKEIPQGTANSILKDAKLMKTRSEEKV